jgi:hypothetical protein
VKTAQNRANLPEELGKRLSRGFRRAHDNASVVVNITPGTFEPGDGLRAASSPPPRAHSYLSGFSRSVGRRASSRAPPGNSIPSTAARGPWPPISATYACFWGPWQRLGTAEGERRKSGRTAERSATDGELRLIVPKASG